MVAGLTDNPPCDPLYHFRVGSLVALSASFLFGCLLVIIIICILLWSLYTRITEYIAIIPAIPSLCGHSSSHLCVYCDNHRRAGYSNSIETTVSSHSSHSTLTVTRLDVGIYTSQFWDSSSSTTGVTTIPNVQLNPDKTTVITRNECIL